MTLFAPQTDPRIFHLPPGVDFLSELLAGLRARAPADPLALADVTIYFNTRRAERRFRELLADGPVAIAPRTRVLTEIAADLPGLPPQADPQRRRLELARLTRAAIESDPSLADPGAAFDLAETLLELLGEMQMEGVDFDDLAAIAPGDRAGHWDRSLKFLDLIAPFAQATGSDGLDPEARFRMAVDAVTAAWKAAPPATPVLVAGSTGSRGATAELMAAVARLPQGAVILPGYDAALPAAVAERLADKRAADHPQSCLVRFVQGTGIDPAQIPPWTTAAPPSPARGRLVSLALRPAPVTDQWLTEGSELGPDLHACHATPDTSRSARSAT